MWRKVPFISISLNAVIADIFGNMSFVHFVLLFVCSADLCSLPLIYNLPMVSFACCRVFEQRILTVLNAIIVNYVYFVSWG